MSGTFGTGRRSAASSSARRVHQLGGRSALARCRNRRVGNRPTASVQMYVNLLFSTYKVGHRWSISSGRVPKNAL